MVRCDTVFVLSTFLSSPLRCPDTSLWPESCPMAPEPTPGVPEMMLVAGSAPQSPPTLMLQLFEGPLDLLLHLIRTNEISITDIPILEICRQYDAYLGLMNELNLEVAGEYLVMAASLAHIKSRMLLPAAPTAPGEQPEDPRADLVRQLLEYQ